MTHENPRWRRNDTQYWVACDWMKSWTNRRRFLFQRNVANRKMFACDSEVFADRTQGGEGH